MKHNKLDLIPSDIVRLDAGKANSSIVRIVKMTPLGMFSRVHPVDLENPQDSDCWDTMTSRLTKIE